MRRHTASSRASAKFLHRPARSLRRTISLLSTFGAVAGVQLQTSRSIKPRERDLGDLRLFVLVRFLRGQRTILDVPSALPTTSRSQYAPLNGERQYNRRPADFNRPLGKRRDSRSQL